MQEQKPRGEGSSPRFQQKGAPKGPQGQNQGPSQGARRPQHRPMRPKAPVEDREDLVCGPNAVEALLQKEPGRVHRVVLLHGSGSVRLFRLQEMADKLKIHTQQLPASKLDLLHHNHQGVVAFCHEKSLTPWEQLFQDVAGKERCSLVIASGVEDPRNLGACIRSALALGSDALLLPNKGGCGLTAAAAKAAAGALEKLPICKPPVLEQAVQMLKDAGFAIYALEGDGESMIHATALSPKAVFITGGEDQGVPPYLRKKSDKVLRLPILEEAHSFNTSVALGMALYEWGRQSEFPGLN